VVEAKFEQSLADPPPHGVDLVETGLDAGLILGTGGDNSDRGLGIWYEGAITSGYATASTEDAVQANIVAAGYGRSLAE
jgi:hypothetical protein